MTNPTPASWIARAAEEIGRYMDGLRYAPPFPVLAVSDIAEIIARCAAEDVRQKQIEVLRVAAGKICNLCQAGEPAEQSSYNEKRWIHKESESSCRCPELHAMIADLEQKEPSDEQ